MNQIVHTGSSLHLPPTFAHHAQEEMLGVNQTLHNDSLHQSPSVNEYQTPEEIFGGIPTGGPPVAPIFPQNGLYLHQGLGALQELDWAVCVGEADSSWRVRRFIRKAALSLFSYVCLYYTLESMVAHNTSSRHEIFSVTWMYLSTRVTGSKAAICK